MGKKKNKKKLKSSEELYDKYDYSDIQYDGNIPELLYRIGEALEYYLDQAETYLIFFGVSEDEWKDAAEKIKDLAEKLKKGNPKGLNIDQLNMILRTQRSPIIGER